MGDEYNDMANNAANATDLDITLDIPDYLPLNGSLVRDFDKAARFQTPLYHTIGSSKQELLKKVEDYIEYIVSNKNFEGAELVLSTYLYAFQNLIESTVMLDAYKSSIDSCKESIKQSTTEVPDISIVTLEEYQKLDGTNFADLIAQSHALSENNNTNVQELEKNLRSDEDYQYVKNIPFIIKNPQDALPDDVEDDELRVSGGKISLKDPITMNYFETPVISSVCHHTYEKSTIERYITEKNTCPINGCREHINKNSLHLDKLMRLRVKVFLALQVEQKDDNANVERIV